MSKKSNVHPDYYKTDGRDRPDDAARARLNRAIAAKDTSPERPDRMSRGFYFERPEPMQPQAAGEPAQKKKASRAGAAKKPGARKGVARKAGARSADAGKAVASRRGAPARKKTPTRRKAGRTAEPTTKKK